MRRAVFAALGVLVMGYPCAVGIAAPLAIVRAAGEAADQGIIMRTGEAFQTFGQTRTVLLDKTGALTEGRPTVCEVEALGPEKKLLVIAAAAEAPSEHPLAQAIVQAAAHRGLTVPAAQEFTSVPGSASAPAWLAARCWSGDRSSSPTAASTWPRWCRW